MIPFELFILIFRFVQKLIGQYKFSIVPERSMSHADEYYHNLLRFCLVRSDWSAPARSEMITNAILRNGKNAAQFAAMLRRQNEWQDCAEGITSIRIGRRESNRFQDCSFDGMTIDEVSIYCPNLVEVNCSRIDVRLIDFSNFRPYQLREFLDND